MDHLLDIVDIRCGYQGETVVDGLNMHIQPGMLTCLLGPSGCGKTTALRAVAGFESISRGEIRLNGVCISRPGFSLPPENRRLGMVFQDYALFPHLSVADNIGFGLHRATRRERIKAAERWLELVGLSGYAGRYPHELSGGQQQRVAVARALAPQPSLLLLDEPFSNLDVELRQRLAIDVRDVLKQQGTAAIFVTHDQHEAFVMGERIGVMNQGRILQWDTPFALYHEPVDRFVADFIGQGRFIDGVMQSPDEIETELGVLRGNISYGLPKGRQVDLLIRPDDVLIGEPGTLRARITDRSFQGAETLYRLQLPSGQSLLSLTPSHQDYPLGQEVGIRFNGDHLILFEKT